MRNDKPPGSRPIDTRLNSDELEALQRSQNLSGRQWDELGAWEQLSRIRQFRQAQAASQQQTETNWSA